MKTKQKELVTYIKKKQWCYNCEEEVLVSMELNLATSVIIDITLIIITTSTENGRHQE